MHRSFVHNVPVVFMALVFGVVGANSLRSQCPRSESGSCRSTCKYMGSCLPGDPGFCQSEDYNYQYGSCLSLGTATTMATSTLSAQAIAHARRVRNA